MRLAIDVSHLNHEKLSGIGVYTVELMRALKKIPTLSLTPVYRPSRFRHAKYFRMHSDSPRPWIFGGVGMTSDILHGPDFRVGSARRAKRVASIMDLAFLKEGMTSPEFAKKKKKDLDSLLDDHTPDALIAISACTAQDLIAYRPNLKDRVHTVLLGGDHMTLDGSNAPIAQSKPFFLFVGNLEARKNVLGIIQAFTEFANNTPGYELVLIGKPGFDCDKIHEAAASSPQSKNIKFLGYCTSTQLQSYYRRAVALVYPSWIEGFGIPVLEAMALGCPVITSRTTSTAEIIGDTSWAVDPAITKEIANAMFEVARLKTQPEKINPLLKAAQARAKTFTWARCAEETLRVYEKLLQQK